MFEHFLEAQEPVFEAALAELAAGRKRSHWMWFVFPQIRGLGRSPMAERFAVRGRGEATDYLDHPVLGERLRSATQAVLRHRGKTAHDIFGSPDDLKFRSSMTLFAHAAQEEALFRDALTAFYAGIEDAETVRRLL